MGLSSDPYSLGSPGVSSSGMAKESAPLGTPNPEVIDKFTDEQCADFILDYMWKLGKAFKRILLGMVERNGIRDTVRGLLQNA